MGDSNELLQRMMKRGNEDRHVCHRLLSGPSLILDEESIPWILNHIDCFVSLSRGNESIEQVNLLPYAFIAMDDDAWDKLGRAIGRNFHALETLDISTSRGHDDRDEVPPIPIPNWEILERILRHVRQKVGVRIDDFEWDVEEMQALGKAIRGHSTITSFDCCYNFPYESMDKIYSALVTLPALESVHLSHQIMDTLPEDESTLGHLESLTELLGAPSLRSVCFDCFSFTPNLCQVIANGFMEGTAVTNLEFSECSFPAEECAAILANGFSRNISVPSIEVVNPQDAALCNALVAALPSNSTLQKLAFYSKGFAVSPVFSALGKNTVLKYLKIAVGISMDEPLCTAMQNGLELNETLESLELDNAHLLDDYADLWCRALSFLRTNKALKSLMINLAKNVTESCASAFRIDIAAMLQDSTSLESLLVESYKSIIPNADEYVALVTALQHNTRLKSLMFQRTITTAIRLTDDDDKRLAAVLKKNYALESLPDIDLENEARDVGAILRLNQAGRRYLVQDGSSISKGVEVLNRVKNDVNCVFLHLLENPRLCDRSAVEMATASESNNSRSTNPTASGGGEKREQASAHTSKESYRRLA
jgi:hypothetical protein